MLPKCIWLLLFGIRRVCDNDSHFEYYTSHTLFLSATSFAHVLHFKSFVERRWQNDDIVYARRPLHKNDSYPSIVCFMIMFILKFFSLCLLCLQSMRMIILCFHIYKCMSKKKTLLVTMYNDYKTKQIVSLFSHN